MPHTGKKRGRTHSDIHTHAAVHTYVAAVFFLCCVFFLISRSLARSHARKQADKATHAHPYTHTRAHSITGLCYKYTLQCRLLRFLSAALEGMPPFHQHRLVRALVGLWRAPVSSFCYTRAGLHCSVLYVPTNKSKPIPPPSRGQAK